MYIKHFDLIYGKKDLSSSKSNTDIDYNSFIKLSSSQA